MESKIRLILEDHWEGFLRNYGNRIRPNVKREVEKVLKCGDIKNGYIEWKHFRHIPYEMLRKRWQKYTS